MTHRRKTLAAVLAATAIATTAQAAPNCGLTGRWHYNTIIVGQTVADCSLIIKTTGIFTATCLSWTLSQPAVSVRMTGKIKANSKCQLSGFTRTPGLTDVTIRGGQVRGTTATFVATRGNPNSPTNVRLVTLTKE